MGAARLTQAFPRVREAAYLKAAFPHAASWPPRCVVSFVQLQVCTSPAPAPRPRLHLARSSRRFFLNCTALTFAQELMDIMFDQSYMVAGDDVSHAAVRTPQ